jgi:hypothetical protein
MQSRDVQHTPVLGRLPTPKVFGAHTALRAKVPVEGAGVCVSHRPRDFLDAEARVPEQVDSMLYPNGSQVCAEVLTRLRWENPTQITCGNTDATGDKGKRNVTARVISLKTGQSLADTEPGELGVHLLYSTIHKMKVDTHQCIYVNSTPPGTLRTKKNGPSRLRRDGPVIPARAGKVRS